MKKQNALILTIVGAIVAVACLALIVVGILDWIDSSQYRDVGLNYPVFVLLAAGLIAGVIVTIVGIKKMKSAK